MTFVATDSARKAGESHVGGAAPRGGAGRARTGARHAARNSRPGAERQPRLPAWTKTFTDPRLCSAIIDRLTLAGNIIETGSQSYHLTHARTQRAS